MVRNPTRAACASALTRVQRNLTACPLGSRRALTWGLRRVGGVCVVACVRRASLRACVAAWNEATGAVEVLDNMQGKRTTPSFVSFTPTGRVVGQPAKDQVRPRPTHGLTALSSSLPSART